MMKKRTKDVSPEQLKRNITIAEKKINVKDEELLLQLLINSYKRRLKNYRSLKDFESDIQFITDELKRIEEYLNGKVEENNDIYRECIINSNSLFKAFSDFKNNYANFLSQLSFIHKTAKSGEINPNDFTGYWTPIIQGLLAYKNHVKHQQLNFIRGDKKIDYTGLGINTINTKLLLLEELGIIDLLKVKLDLHCATNTFADLVAIILNEDSKSVIRSLRYFSSDENRNKEDKNNPSTKRNFLIIKKAFEELELPMEIDRIDKVIRNKYP